MIDEQQDERAERLYQALPVVYRLRDAQQGQPLRALLTVLERELGLVEADIAALYENWFVETCDEWVVPYIGDLIGVRGLDASSMRSRALQASGTTAHSQRARVANAVQYRRRKGTAAMLEQLARDVTGWSARAVELFEHLAATQFLNHVRPGRGGTADLRGANALELIGGPFDQFAHTANVRAIDDGLGTPPPLRGRGVAPARPRALAPRGGHNIPNVGIFLWRLQAYPVARGAAATIAAAGEGRYTFDPTGRDTPLFNRRRTEEDAAQLSTEINVPGRLRARALHDELQRWRAARDVAGSSPDDGYFADPVVLRVYLDGAAQPLPPSEIVVGDLTDWRRPDTAVHTIAGGATYTPRIIVDPVRGRLVSPKNVPLPSAVEVSYAYGLAGDIGAGPYNRRAALLAWLDAAVEGNVWQIGVTSAPSTTTRPLSAVPYQVATLREAVTHWNACSAGTVGIISIMDSRTYADDLDGGFEIRLREGSRLLITAADWPTPPAGALAGTPPADEARLQVALLRPHLAGKVSVRGIAPAESTAPGELTIDGLLVERQLIVQPGNLGALVLTHSTLVPGAGGSLRAAALGAQRNERLAVRLERCITGPIEITRVSRGLSARESVIDAGAAASTLAISAPALALDACTVLGATDARTLEASNTIFTGPTTVERRQSGCVRFSFVAPGSATPRRFRCQPESGQARRVVPQFTGALYGAPGTAPYGQPGYAQLAATCAAEILFGAEDEDEMGAFHFVQQQHRLAALRGSLDEYLRLGLDAGIFLVT